MRDNHPRVEKTVFIRSKLPCIEPKRNHFYQGNCDKCKKLRLVFALYIGRVAAGIEDPLFAQETYCVRCLVSTVNKKYFMDFLRLENNWEEATTKYPVIDELRLTTDLFRCQMSSVSESGHRSTHLGDDVAFINYVIRERLTQTEKLNGQLTYLLSSVIKKVTEKEKLLAFKVLHDNLNCMVTLHMMLMKRTISEKFESFNK